MKFPRNARIFRGQLDAAPFAAVLFLIIIFLMLKGLVYTPGVSLELPTIDNLPGSDRRSEGVAIDANGRLYFKNAAITESALKRELQAIATNTAEPVELVIQADKRVSLEVQLHLMGLARDAGILHFRLAALPAPAAPPARSSLP